MRIALRTPLDQVTGYGNDGVDLARSLSKAGLDVVVWPSTILPGIPKDVTDLIAKEPFGHYDIALTFAPPFDVKPWEFAHLADKAVGWSMWEKTPLVRVDMDGHGWPHPYRRRTFWGEPLHKTRRKEYLDLMLVTCPANVTAFRELDPWVEYGVQPCGVAPEDWPEMEHGHPDGRMRFGMCGMLAGRKDPWIMLQAWRELKDEYPDFDAVLEMKTSCPGLHPAIVEAYKDVVLYMEVWPRAKLVEWYSTIDVMVSTSRGEGNNKPCMEFMCTGGVAMATDWSGHQNWMHDDWSYPLNGKLVTWSDDVRQDFRVDKEHLKAQIMAAWSNPKEVKRKGRTSRGVILASLTWEHVAERLALRFAGLLG